MGNKIDRGVSRIHKPSREAIYLLLKRPFTPYVERLKELNFNSSHTIIFLIIRVQLLKNLPTLRSPLHNMRKSIPYPLAIP